MAKLSLTLDTESQEMSVDIDGTAVDNSQEIMICNWGDGDKPEFSFCVTSVEKVGGVRKMTRLMAKDSREARDSIAEGNRPTASRAIAGFVEMPAKSKIEKQFEDWFRSTRRS